MADDYEAGAELDAEAQAFLDRETAEPEARPVAERPAPAKDYDPEEDDRLNAPAKAKADPEPEPDPDPEPVKASAEPSDPEIEALAKDMGWAPQSEWRGDPEKWSDAETFIKRGLGNPAMLLERYKASTKKHKDTLERVERMNAQALANQKAQLDAERDALIEQYAGDPDAIRQINQNHAEAVSSLAPPELPKETKEWKQFEATQTDPLFGKMAFEICEQNKHLPAAEQLKLVDQQLAARFPEYYEKPKAADNDAPPANARQIDGVRVSGARKSNYASRLPADVKPIAEKFVKQGLFKSVEEYAKDFFND